MHSTNILGSLIIVSINSFINGTPNFIKSSIEKVLRVAKIVLNVKVILGVVIK